MGSKTTLSWWADRFDRFADWLESRPLVSFTRSIAGRLRGMAGAA